MNVPTIAVTVIDARDSADVNMVSIAIGGLPGSGWAPI